MLVGLCLGSSWAQTRAATISGFIRDASDGEGLISATLQLDGTSIGTITNSSGYYVLPQVAPGQYVLVCTYIGYRTLRQPLAVAAGEQVKFDLSLEPEAVTTEEVVIRADSMRTSQQLYEKPISEIRLSQRQINAVPQVAEADLLRALQSLPGVLPLSDFSSALYVRGGTPDQNLYLVDGTDVYNPEHAFGIFSTFNTDAIKQVHLSKGGFGAEYGGRLSSVLDVTNLDGNREQFEGKASISLLSAKTTLQAPLGRLGSLSGSLRRTYFDQTVGRALDEVPDYYFYDGNIKVYLDLTERDKLTLSGFGGRDFLEVIFNQDATEEIGFQADWGNKTGSARWTRVFTPQLFANFWVTGSRFTSDFNLDVADVKERNLVTDFTFKGNLEHHYSQHWITRFGFEQKNLHVRFKQIFPEGLIDVGHRPEHYVGYAQGSWRPSPLWEVESGLRFNRFASDKTFNNWAPRLAVKHRLSDTVNLRGATGVYYQYLHRVPRFIATDIWTAANQYQGPSRSIHGIIGLQKEWKRNYQLEVEGYYKDYRDIYSFNQTFLSELEETSHMANGDPVFTNTKGLFHRGNGHSLGFEFMLRKDTGALTGWVAYSLARTRYEVDNVNRGNAFSPRHDRTQTINFVSNIDLQNGWRKLHGQPKLGRAGRWSLGLNFVYGTGQPFTEPGSGYIIGSSPQSPRRYVEYAPTLINNIRIPAYSRMDIGLTYRRGWFSFYLQVFNAGNRKNVWFFNYDYEDGLPDTDATGMLPRLPTIGFNFEF